MRLDELERDLRQLVNDQPPASPGGRQAVARRVRRRRTRIGVVGGVAVVAAALAAALALRPATGSHQVITASGSGSVLCPGQYDPRTKPRTPGLADTLPEAGTTTRAKVLAAFPTNEPLLKASLGADRITVGPGWGLAYKLLSPGNAEIVDETNYAYIAHFSNEAACNQIPTFGSTVAGDRVTVIFVVDIRR